MYIQFIPAVGVVSMIVPVFARRRLTGYTFITLSILATGFISFGLWVHHMFTVGLPALSLALFTAASMTIAIPSGIQVFAWLATIWGGRIVWKTPFLFVVGFLVTFVAGGLTGVMLAAVPFNWQVHDSYFVVAHFHYVMIGGVVFPIFAGIYYWTPKFTGKLLHEGLGRWNFWLVFLGFHIAFFPMHIAGLLGMPRRVYTYPEGLGWQPYNLVSTIGAFILAGGILVFLWNVLWTYRRGEQAGPNPWGADTLEWATSSPPPQYGFRTLPIVHSRHPLWDQEGLDKGDERVVKLVRALAQWPRDYRSQLITTTIDARPQEIFQIAGPSIWPLMLSIGITVISIAFIFDFLIIAGLGVLLSVASLIAWHWPDEKTAATGEEAAFEAEHGVPVNVAGSREVARWGMYLTIITLAIVIGTMIFSYFFLRLDSAQWPPIGISLPPLLWPSIGTGLLVASALPLIWATRGIRRGTQRPLKVGLAASLVLGSVALVAQVTGYLDPGFSWRTHAYGSLFWTTAAFQSLFMIGGLIMNIMTQYWAWAGNYDRRHYQTVENTALYWYFTVVSGLVVFATLYLAPYII